MSGTLTNNGNVPLAIGYGLHPGRGEVPKAVSALFDWTTGIVSYNHLLPSGENKLKIVQAVYVDNSQNSAFMVLTVSGTGFRLVVPATSCGYFPLVMSPGNHRVNAASIGGSGMTTATFLNMPIPPFVWSI